MFWFTFDFHLFILAFSIVFDAFKRDFEYLNRIGFWSDNQNPLHIQMN